MCLNLDVCLSLSFSLLIVVIEEQSTEKPLKYFFKGEPFGFDFGNGVDKFYLVDGFVVWKLSDCDR